MDASKGSVEVGLLEVCIVDGVWGGRKGVRDGPVGGDINCDEVVVDVQEAYHGYC